MTIHVETRTAYYGSHPCSLANTMLVVGERWTFMVLREALAGTTKFGEFRSTLGLTADMLSARLKTLVESGVMERRTYRQAGQRPRDSYHLTSAGEELSIVLAALQEWGDKHTPSPVPSTVEYQTTTARPVSVSFVDQEGTAVPQRQVVLQRTASHPLAGTA